MQFSYSVSLDVVVSTLLRWVIVSAAFSLFEISLIWFIFSSVSCNQLHFFPFLIFSIFLICSKRMWKENGKHKNMQSHFHWTDEIEYLIIGGIWLTFCLFWHCLLPVTMVFLLELREIQIFIHIGRLHLLQNSTIWHWASFIQVIIITLSFTHYNECSIDLPFKYHWLLRCLRLNALKIVIGFVAWNSFSAPDERWFNDVSPANAVDWSFYLPGLT